MRISVKVVARASHARFQLMADGSSKAWVTAPPVDGKANEAVRELLAEHFGCAKSRVELVAGQTSTRKVFDVPDKLAWS